MERLLGAAMRGEIGTVVGRWQTTSLPELRDALDAAIATAAEAGHDTVIAEPIEVVLAHFPQAPGGRPADSDVLRDMVRAITGTSMVDLRDRALRSIGMMGAFRRSELVAALGITINGDPMPLGNRTLTHEARVRFGEAELIISPPAAAASAEEAFSAAQRKHLVALEDLRLADLAAARARNDAARDGAANVRTLEAQIKSITPADEAIDLIAGSEALKLFVAKLGDDDAREEGGLPDPSR